MSKALKAAIEANDPVAVTKAAKSVKDLNRKLPGSTTPVLLACETDADQALEALLGAGAALGGAGDADHPLAIAARKNASRVVRFLAARTQVPASVLEDVLLNAIMNGREESLRILLENFHPPITTRMLELSTWWTAGHIFRALLEFGANVNVLNAGEADPNARGRTALHSAASSGHAVPVRLLLDAGARPNVQDVMGRTPLMDIARMCEFLLRQEAGNERRREAQLSGAAPPSARPGKYGDRTFTDCRGVIRLLLERGADPAICDTFGNDALDHYLWEVLRSNALPEESVVSLFKGGGVQGHGHNLALAAALRQNDLTAIRAAIAAGAEVDHRYPEPVSSTPLLWCKSLEAMELLLQAGADPNLAATNTPLIAVAGSGDLAMVKRLIAAGANIHALAPRKPHSEYIANAYSAARQNGKAEVAEYLRSLGAGMPVANDWEPLKPGVGMWENFAEILIKGSAPRIAASLSKSLGAKFDLDPLGKALAPGKTAFLLLEPKGMQWTNFFQIAPDVSFFSDPARAESVCGQLAKDIEASVLLIFYGDAAGAAETKRFEPDGAVTHDDSWDEDSLQETVEFLGKDAPAWMKQRLKAIQKSDKPALSSTQRLELLAAQEKFVVASFFPNAEAGKPFRLEFSGIPKEAFQAAAWIST